LIIFIKVDLGVEISKFLTDITKET